jgi:hypothetical protein
MSILSGFIGGTSMCWLAHFHVRRARYHPNAHRCYSCKRMTPTAPKMKVDRRVPVRH